MARPTLDLLVRLETVIAAFKAGTDIDGFRCRIQAHSLTVIIVQAGAAEQLVDDMLAPPVGAIPIRPNVGTSNDGRTRSLLPRASPSSTRRQRRHAGVDQFTAVEGGRSQPRTLV